MGRRRALGGLLLAAALAGCNPDGYAFRVDETIDIVAPRSRSTVALPLEVHWRDEQPPPGARVAPGDPAAEYYAVFVDRAPIRPGAGVVSVIDDIADDERCLATPGCPDPAALRDNGVILTAVPQVQLDFVRDLRPTARGGEKDAHELTIVRMRGDRRVGEAAFRVTFFVER